MKKALRTAVVAVVMRVVHAAIVELYAMGDTRVRAELDGLHEGQAYSIAAGACGPVLHVQWRGGRLHRLAAPAPGACALRIKSLPLAFRLFTGQLGLAQAYAWHAFTVRGEVAEVMQLARLVNLVEAYLFPRFITKHILTDIPALQANPLRVYGRLLCGFLSARYPLSDAPGA